MNNYEQMFFNQSGKSSKADMRTSANFGGRPPSGASNSRHPLQNKNMVHPKDAQYVTFQQESSQALDKELPGGNQYQQAYSSSRPIQDSPQRKLNSSNLKGDSEFQPIGITPREEELALIESLTQ